MSHKRIEVAVSLDTIADTVGAVADAVRRMTGQPFPTSLANLHTPIMGRAFWEWYTELMGEPSFVDSVLPLTMGMTDNTLDILRRGHDVVIYGIYPRLPTWCIAAWLARNRIPYTRMVRLVTAEKLPGDVVIETFPHVIEEALHQGKKVIILSQPWNTEVAGGKHCDNWWKIRQVISNIIMEREWYGDNIHSTLHQMMQRE